MGKVHKDIAVFLTNNSKDEDKSDEDLVTVSSRSGFVEIELSFDLRP